MSAPRALLLLSLVPLCALPAAAAPAAGPGRWVELGNGVSVMRTGASYAAETRRPGGWFRSGQAADIALSSFGFGNAGGPLLFNHPGVVASDGTHLLLADRNNNRVLVWKKLPAGNTKPDLVLGQRTFTGNLPGTGRDRMRWPVSVSAAAGKVVVADTYNDRLLVWTRFPTRSGQPADLVLNAAPGGPGGDPKRALVWPWGVWTDGTKLAATTTGGGAVLLWNAFPVRDDQPAELVLSGGGHLGTPRTITSDGRSLIVGDHNPRRPGVAPGTQGNFVWASWPAGDDEPYDYYLADPVDARGAWLQGTFTASGTLALLGTRLYLWNGLPAAPTAPALTVESPSSTASGQPPGQFYFGAGDGSGAAAAGGRLYLSLSNSNYVLGFSKLPTTRTQAPDFVLGSEDRRTSTLETNFLITNPVPVTDGKSLFVCSDFDRKLYVWKKLPRTSGAHPDLVYRLPVAPWQCALHGQTLALAGRDTVIVWKRLPFGQAPDLVLQRSLGGVEAGELRGVALDGRRTYLADRVAGKVYVWEGLPSASTPPQVTLSVPFATRLSSDGTHLAVTRTEAQEGGKVWLYRLDGLSAASSPARVGSPGAFNLPEHALVAGGRLFVADTVFNRVHAWQSADDAVAGKPAGAVLGGGGRPSTTRAGLFWPAALAFDGSYLWAGEFKFSGRIVRFSVR